MYKLEIKQGSIIQQTQYFIPVEINNFYRICPDFLTCPVGQPKYKIYLSDVSFHWYWTNVNVEACNIIIMSVTYICMTGWWFFPGPPVSSTNKTDCLDIAEILLKEKVVLKTIKQTNKNKHPF